MKFDIEIVYPYTLDVFWLFLVILNEYNVFNSASCVYICCNCLTLDCVRLHIDLFLVLDVAVEVFLLFRFGKMTLNNRENIRLMIYACTVYCLIMGIGFRYYFNIILLPLTKCRRIMSTLQLYISNLYI